MNEQPMNEQRSRRSTWFWVMIGGGLFALFLAVIVGLAFAIVHATGGGELSSFGSGLGSGNIGVIDVDGVILSAETPIDQLRKFADDSSIRAIILHINSPGGGAAASQEIYEEVKRIRDQKKKPIIASIESVGASGAYYIAAGTSKIYANRASIVGSIGVIMEYTNYGDLLKWAKLKNVTIKAGDLKDAGSPTRDLTPKEQAYMQGLVDNMHQQFIDDVASGRRRSVTEIQPLATGQVWTGQQAVPLHLIDSIGSFQDALRATAKEVGISGEPQVVKPFIRRKTLLDILTSPGDLFPGPDKLLERNVGFYFLWR
jgi:protease IV